MTDLLVFNHHSLPFSTKAQAEDAIPEFLEICIKCKNIGLNTILVDDTVDGNWFRLKLFENYYWQDWYNTHQKDNAYTDIVRAFRSIKTSQPLFSPEDIEKHVDLYEVEFQNKKNCSALVAASWNEAPITSFPSDAVWQQSPLRIIKRMLNQDGDIEERSDNIVNFYSIAVYESLKSDFLFKRNQALIQGADIYKQWTTLYPDLQHCGKVREQLMRWSAATTILSQVKDALTILNQLSELWKNGDIRDYSHDHLKALGLNHKVTGESEGVRNNSDLRREREFHLPNGEKAFFQNHIKISNGYRIHFYPDEKNRKIVVGYIGKHLRLPS